MPLCKYCGKPTGKLLAFAHPDCVDTYKKGKKEVSRLLEESFRLLDLAKLDLAREIAEKAFIKQKEFSKLLGQLLPKAIEKALEDHLLTEKEAIFLHSANRLLTKEEAEKISSSLNALNKATILSQLAKGEFPTISIQGTMPFVLQKGEQPVWVEENVVLYEYRVEKEYLSSGLGVSIRIAKGVYLRPSQYRTRQVIARESLKKEDVGILLVTNKHLYFGGKKIKRIPLNKLIGVRLYKDAIEFHLDGNKAKAFALAVADPGFIANLINFLL